MKIKIINKKSFLVAVSLVIAFISGIILNEAYWRYKCDGLLSLEQMKYVEDGTNGTPLLSPNGKYVALNVREGSTSSVVWLFAKAMKGRYNNMPHDVESIVWKWYKGNHKVPYEDQLPDHAYARCEKWLDNEKLVISLDGHDSSTKYGVEECCVVFDIETVECYEYKPKS